MLKQAPGSLLSPTQRYKASSALRDKLAFCMANPERILFLDIETTGLSHHYDEITVIGWSLDGRVQTMIKGESSSRLIKDAKRAKALVTFNGIRFDARFIRQELPEVPLPELHVDLMYLLRRVGLKGGQKSIERELELDLRTGLADVDGFAAVLLWHQYQRGDREALHRLVRYNRADIAAMGALFDEAIDRLEITPDLFSSQTRFFSWAAPEGWDAPPTFARLPKQKTKPPTFDFLFGDKSAATARVVGIDLTGSEKKASGWCLLDGRHAQTSLIASDDDLIAATIAAEPELVSIDSPLSLPAGRITVEDSDPGREQFGIMRWCERELKRRGVNVYPSLLPSMQKLTARGLRLAAALRKRGIPVIESYPGAAQDIMRIPRKGAGEIWLQTGLSEFGITGAYQTARVSHDELDAITSALVGTFHLAGMTEALGTPEEAPLIIPMPNAKPGPTVIGISGPIGAGKTSLARLLEERGFSYTRFSLVIDDILRERGLSLNRENRQRVGHEINATGRQRWLAEQTLARVETADRIVVDGLRFAEDHAFLKERFGARFHHVHVLASANDRRARTPEAGSPVITNAPVESEISTLQELANLIVANDGAPEALQQHAEKLIQLTR